jgi:hypothetical protein
MSSDRGFDRSRSPAVRFAVRAAVAGVVLGCAVGLAAYNNWLVSLLVGVPLVVTALVISPRPRRIDGMLKAGQSRKQIPVTIEALTRSSLDASDVQPTLVTATISPPNDTDYRARWLTAMPKPVAATVLQDADTTLPSALIPPRPDTSLSYDAGLAPGKATEFGNHPPNSTLLQPLITILVAVALFVGVGGGWHISVSLPDAGLSTSDDETNTDFRQRMNSMLAEVSKLGPTASDNILKLEMDEGDYDRAEVFDPLTGESIGTYYSPSSGDWSEPKRTSTTFRHAKTYKADELAGLEFSSVINDRMPAAIPDESNDFKSIQIERAADNEPVLATAIFGEGDSEVSIQANVDGQIATFFDPGDFATSVVLAEEALTASRVPLGEPVITRFEIRGIAPNTPTMRAGYIQTTGGVLVEFTDSTTDGTIAIEPGHFPAPLNIRENLGGKLQQGAVSFTDLSASTFDAVREDVMRRRGIELFDRNAVDIQTSYQYVGNDYQMVIMVAIGPNYVEDVYTLDGKLLKAGDN